MRELRPLLLAYTTKKMSKHQHHQREKCSLLVLSDLQLLVVKELSSIYVYGFLSRERGLALLFVVTLDHGQLYAS